MPERTAFGPLVLVMVMVRVLLAGWLMGSWSRRALAEVTGQVGGLAADGDRLAPALGGPVKRVELAVPAVGAAERELWLELVRVVVASGGATAGGGVLERAHVACPGRDIPPSEWAGGPRPLGGCAPSFIRPITHVSILLNAAC
jgi:hypothetical protein